MISQPQIYLDDQPTVWLPRLVQWATEASADYAVEAARFHSEGKPQTAASFTATASEYQRIALRASARLETLLDERIGADIAPPKPKHNHTVHCPITDCAEWLPQDEPPSTLVPFVAWLRGKLGRWFPTMPAEIWQGIGFVLLSHRRPS